MHLWSVLLLDCQHSYVDAIRMLMVHVCPTLLFPVQSRGMGWTNTYVPIVVATTRMGVVGTPTIPVMIPMWMLPTGPMTRVI